METERIYRPGAKPVATVGQFSMEGGTITGPKLYMESQAYQKVREKIESGRSVIVQSMSARGDDLELAILVAIQTDYAGWLGLGSGEWSLSPENRSPFGF